MLDMWVDGWCKGNGTDAAYAGYTLVYDTKVCEGLVPANVVQSNNTAEYYAVIEALRLAASLGTPAVIHTDSALVFGQLTQGWKVKAAHLRPLVRAAKEGMCSTMSRLVKEPRENIVTVVGH